MLLSNKNAVIYGAGGAIGRVVAHAFAREGAVIFLAGRTLSKLDGVAEEISAAGGMAETAVVDALEKQVIEAHAAAIVGKVGRIDISFNAISMDDVQGIPLAEMSQEDFVRPIDIAVRSQFLTATAAARHMARQGRGVILILTATPARLAIPHCGGFGVACAALEALSRQLAAEVGPNGVRVVCLRSAGSPESISETMDVHAAAGNIARDDFIASLAEMTVLKRLPALAEVGDVAALVASDYASPMTGTVANMTCGAIVD
ncbi:NAD(P)-dependent dehydrogenase (short-subunit alcohol dehydrogenase family) [Natronocella acetinitrilica]|uniref:NAD(P)-dependent dehydrogenase (Short-subunit alcohol dehydrogenase family) n=1 Tax=Natronocella acetinitrilica TaxID=414046 RepID=A0AAE3G7E3_9GAMM|nr:SDR family oxidoreductase [Natronocella acetinitrilica]MCP1677049.1 NAD(P)-dependent dehydrogenase (short-subunit alcohol dehydrogenase family) [Natronocella acetinitrilica]